MAVCAVGSVGWKSGFVMIPLRFLEAVCNCGRYVEYVYTIPRTAQAGYLVFIETAELT